MRPLLLLLFICIFTCSDAQYSISGRIANEQSEALSSAVAFLQDTEFASVSDIDGQFILNNIPAGKYLFKVTYLGYKTYADSIELTEDMRLDVILQGSKYQLDEIEVTANQLDEASPFSYTQVTAKDLDIKEGAQDLPFLLEYNPSMVVSSDAGAGVGYTSMRVRGSDATRVNITVNGVPVNDSESHGVFWVNMPDFASSVDDLQIQRGVGPSTNGAAAFGATVSMNTNRVKENSSIKIEGTYGSFNTRKLSFNVNTGLINDRWNIEGRYSRINSDGYVDRASSELESYYFSVSHLGKKSSLSFITFSGSERTYQSWWGVPEARLDNDEDALLNHYNNNPGTYLTPQDSVNLFDSDRRYNYYLYDDQVDDYGQDHYQMIWKQQAHNNWNFNLTAHYTRGRGFFEEYKVNEQFSDYGLELRDSSDEPVQSSDLVRRRWLDNHFLGFIFNNDITLSDRAGLLLGSSSNVYLGDHFGNVIYARDAVIIDPEYNYYFSDATKWDNNLYAKLNWQASDKLLLFADLQARSISYESMGNDNDLLPIDIDTSYTFFNPKLGLTWTHNQKSQFYISLARSEREPVRSDFIDAIGTQVPETEKLWDLELGHRLNSASFVLQSNIYFMHYKDQLVLTGAVNDVGAPVRTNVDQSYRLGLELDGLYRFNSNFSWRANLSLSRNRIDFFEEQLFDYSNNTIVINAYDNRNIAFSPDVILGSSLNYAWRDIDIILLSKYVGRQFLDNTSNEARALDAYFYSDLVVSYTPSVKGIENLSIKLMVNNLMNAEYASNAYTYSYIFGDLITENFYYPQAGRNVLVNASFSF